MARSTFPMSARRMISQCWVPRGNSRTFLVVPLRQQGELIGTLIARRIEVRPFTPAQIKLLETFADQAVIAIENVRLFHELKESLEQQTATSEILGVIASSPTDIQPVLDAVAENAARLCDADDAVIRLVEVIYFATWRPIMGQCQARTCRRRSLDRRHGHRSSDLDRQTIHVRDLRQRSKPSFRNLGTASKMGIRTMLGCTVAARRRSSSGSL